MVDDEDFVRDLLGEILEGEHCEVYLAESGSEALTLFRDMEFDGVFTDVGMPGMSGWELAREIRLINNERSDRGDYGLGRGGRISREESGWCRLGRGEAVHG